LGRTVTRRERRKREASEKGIHEDRKKARGADG
jgi:hypothetical protein